MSQDPKAVLLALVACMDHVDTMRSLPGIVESAIRRAGLADALNRDGKYDKADALCREAGCEFIAYARVAKDGTQRDWETVRDGFAARLDPTQIPPAILARLTAQRVNDLKLEG